MAGIEKPDRQTRSIIGGQPQDECNDYVLWNTFQEIRYVVAELELLSRVKS